jgi:hypothetical protein
VPINLIDFARRQPRVYYHRPRADLAAAEYQRAKRDRILAHQKHAIAGPDPEARQVLRHRRDSAPELSIAPAPAPFDESWVGRPIRNVGYDHLADAIWEAGQNIRRRYVIECRCQCFLPQGFCRAFGLRLFSLLYRRALRGSNRFFHVAQLVFPKKHFLADEECWRPKRPTIDGVLGQVQQAIFHILLLRTCEQSIEIDVG